MANNNKKNKKDNKKKDFVNPATKPWGKILIAFLSISFILATLALVIYFIILSFLQV